MFHIQQFRVDYLLQALLRNFSSNSTLAFSFHQVSPLLSTVFFVLSIGGILFLIRKISGFTHALKEPSVILELTPPSNVEQSAFMTEQLCIFLHSLGERISIQERILGKKSRFGLEIVSSQNKGIRYLLRTGLTNADVIQKALLSYLPTLSIKTVEDYLPSNLTQANHSKILEFKLAKHFALPLRKHASLDDFDPIAYVTGMMTKLSSLEFMAIQLVISPSRPREVERVKKLIFHSGDIIGYLKKPKYVPFLGVQEGLTNTSSFEQEFTKNVHGKISQPLFESTLRVFLRMKDQQSLVFHFFVLYIP